MDEQTLKRAIAAYVESGVPGDADIRQVVLRRTTERGRTRSGLRRARWGIVGGIAFALLAGTALAVADGNLPIRFELVPIGPAPAASVTGGNGRAAEVKAAARGDGKGPPSGDPTSSQPLKRQPSPISLEAVRQAFGPDLLTLTGSGAVLQAAYFASAKPLPSDAKPGTPPSRDSAELVYTNAAGQVALQEERDPGNTPLTVIAADVNGSPELKTTTGLGPADIETVNGSQYGVGRTPDGSAIATITWKTSGGIIVTARFDPGLDSQTAFALVAAVR